MKRISLIIFCLSLLSWSMYAMTGEEIMKKFIESTDRAFRATADGVTLDPNGKVTNNFFGEQMRYKDSDGIRKKIFMIQRPANKAGTRFLTVENSERKDDIWAYTPELRQVRRMPKSENYKGMLGTHDHVWTLEDTEIQYVDDYNIEILREETIDDIDCYLLELVKKDQSNTQYSKIHFWVVKDTFVEKRREFYNKDGKKFKVQEFMGYMQIPGGWTHRIMKVTNLDTEYITSYRIQNAAYGKSAKVRPEFFTLRFVETGRVR